jgi:tripartite-type tricarboxylate transporter receptor subunit TctC
MRLLMRGMLAALPLFAVLPYAFAQDYPTRPITIVVPYTPGGSTEILARFVGQKLEQRLGKSVVIENKPGAGTVIGSNLVAKSAPDGYTLYWGANGAMTINPSLLPNPAFDPQRDLAPIARLLVSPSILAVNNDVPAKTVAELIALARAQPGKLSFASPGTGTPQHIGGEIFKSQLGLDIVHVPYRGANFTDVIGGRVTMTFQNTGAILPTVREGKLRGLAVTSLKRSSRFRSL